MDTSLAPDILPCRISRTVPRLSWCASGSSPVPDASLGPQWRGSVENLASGERRLISDIDAIAAFIRDGFGIAQDAKPPVA